ncbi:MAG TPA: ABC transporter ATP-binding protein [Steroidobacteraceae bacterium]|jgi:sulfate transport system ATP-binding protein|nr:ABC transporter ATP-binding protein [Steroidobacteraceae bacterium]
MSIALDQVTKRYQDQPVVNDVSIEVGEGEFFVLLGPSGSGKSTLLRAVAGLTGIDHGRISLHGRDVTHVRARDRGVGLVFQNYALFRHMTVADNIEFALRVRRMKGADRRARRKELLKLVALEGMDERLPGQLSGGQQQRVAVARALAHKPQVLLLDEPFGALDAKIREELRRTIRSVQRELGITTVLVTHDQEEAFALADTIGVMNHGRLLEVGNPNDLYAQPATRFVATFLGAANLLLARQGADGIRFGATPVNAEAAEPLQAGREHEVVAVLRPEEVEIASAREQLTSNYIARGAVEEIVFTGALERLRVRLLDEPCAAQLLGPSGNGDARLEITRTQPERRILPLSPGAQIAIGARRLHVLPTPLSSFLACGATEADAAALAREPLLESLSTRMKTRVGLRAIDGLSGTPAPFAGVAAIAAGEGAAATVEWLLRHGAAEVLVLPRNAPSPTRVIIHWTDEAARRATLAVAASLLRHVSAEAMYLGIVPESRPGAQRPAPMRALLDARSEAQQTHGLEMRTELAIGETVTELTRNLSAGGSQMLVLGITDIAHAGSAYRSLLAAQPGWPVLIVYRPAETRAASELVASGTAA